MTVLANHFPLPPPPDPPPQRNPEPPWWWLVFVGPVVLGILYYLFSDFRP